MKSLIAVLCMTMAVGAIAAEKQKTAAAAATTRHSGSRNYGYAGCGLGSQVFTDKGFFAQTCASTTNGTSFNQFFGISSGTSNCEATQDEIAQIEFINGNLASLQKEIAQGSGESLAALSQVLGCEASAYPALTRELKAKHSTIFATPGAVPVWNATLDAVHDNAELATQCQKIG